MAKKNDDAGYRAAQRVEVQREIQQGKLNIDRSVFTKTSFDRKTLKMLKREWKNNPPVHTTIRSK